MPRFDEMPQYVAKLPKSGHDLSHDFGFTATVAHLLPVFHTVVSPGDKIRLGVKYHLRTMPMQAAAMMRLRSHVEFFYVPMQLLYQPFSSMSFGVHDEFSSLFPNGVGNSGVQAEFPVLDFDDMVTDLTGNKSNPAVGAAGTFETVGQNAYRLFEMLGYNPVGIVSSTYPTTTTGWNPNVFPYPILAYNCIYQYYYRLDTRELFDQASFNWDKFYNTALVTTSGWTSDYVRLHYRPMVDDYFNNIKVSPIVDVLNLNGRPQSLSLAESWLSRFNFSSGNYPVLTSGDEGSPGLSNVNSPDYYSGNRRNSVATQFGFSGIGNGTSTAEAYNNINGMDINTANIRAMFANEKLWSVTGRAKKHYDDQVLAHFGVRVPHDVKHELSVFGHDQSTIAIGEVFNTSDSYDPGTGTGTPLGEIAGKGYGSQDPNGGDRVNYHEFTAPVHGVVMAIFSVVPDYNYESTYPKYNVLTDRQSLPIPEYDHLGMQPLFGYEDNIRNAYNVGTQIRGWQYRYEQWKRRYNRVTTAFANNVNGSLRSWMMSISPYHNGNPSSAANTTSYLSFVSRPADLNQVMLAQYPKVWSNAFESSQGAAIYNNDPFVIDMHIDCKLSSWMSDYSLPRLDA